MQRDEVDGWNRLGFAAWRRMSGQPPEARRLEAPGIADCWAGSPFAFWNVLFLTELDPDVPLLERRLAAAAEAMAGQPHSGFLAVNETGLDPATLATLAARSGLEPALTMTLMAGAVPGPTGRAAPDLRIERVADPARLARYGQINCAAYDIPADLARPAMAHESFWIDEAHTFLGLVGDRPVTTASAFEHGGALYLALVATDAAYRRRGYAEAIIRHALSAAATATGATRTFLHGTDAGFPTYRRLGYEPLIRQPLFMLRTDLGEDVPPASPTGIAI